MGFIDVVKKNKKLYIYLHKLYTFLKVVKGFVYFGLNRLMPFKKKECNANSLRCESDFFSANYMYSTLGKDSPKCCANYLFELTSFIDETFRSNDLEYLMVYGTFLGAVRHKGLIPWDTDIDLAVFEEDLERVESVFKSSIKGKTYDLEIDLNKKLIRLFYSKTNRLHVDFYLYRKDDQYFYINGNVVTYKINLKDIFPLKEYGFYNKKFFGPQTTEMLTMCYGRDVLEKSYKQWSFSKKRKVITDFKPAKI